MAYPPLQLGTPGAPACPDDYTQASTIGCGGSTRLVLQVALNAVYLSFGKGIGFIEWGPDEPYLPTQASLARAFDAVRVRNFTVGQAAQVQLLPLGADD